MINSFGGKIDQEYEIERLKRDINDMGLRLENIGRKNVEEAGESMEKYYERMKEKSNDAIRQAKAAKQKVGEYTREHPLTAIAIGVGVGMLLGMMISKSAKEDKEY